MRVRARESREEFSRDSFRGSGHVIGTLIAFFCWGRFIPRRGGAIMDKQVPVDPGARADETQHGSMHEVAPDLAYQRLAIVNVAYHGRPGAGDRQWVLIDAG